MVVAITSRTLSREMPTVRAWHPRNLLPNLPACHHLPMYPDDPEKRIAELERQLAEQKRIAELERQLAELKGAGGQVGHPEQQQPPPWH